MARFPGVSIVEGGVGSKVVGPIVAILAMGLIGGCQTVPRDQPTAQAPQTPAPVEVVEEPAEPARVPTDGKVRVGMLLPLSGQAAPVGQALLQAAELALFDAGIERIVLMPRDTAGNPNQARAMAQELLDDGVQILLGPLLSPAVGSVAPIANAAGVPILAFTTDQKRASQNVFVMGFVPESQVTRVVRYARAQGLNEFAALAQEGPYGDVVVSALYSSVAEAGPLGNVASVTKVDRYAGGDFSVLNATVRRLTDYDRRQTVNATDPSRFDSLDPPFDALLLPMDAAQLNNVLPLLPYYDVDGASVTFLGTGLWDDPAISADPTIHGGWFAAPDPSGFASFASQYATAFGSPPPRIASLGYDAMIIAALVGVAVPDGANAYDVADLTAPVGFPGKDGLIRLLPDGRVDRALAVLEVTPNGPRVIDPAPTDLQPLIN